MATNVAQLAISVKTGDVKRATDSLNKMEKQGAKTERATDRLTKSSKNLATSLTSLPTIMSAVAGSLLVREYIKYADAMTLVNSKLQLATDSTKELTIAQNELFSISQKTRTQFTSTVDLYERVTRSVRDYEVSQKEVLSLTETINKSMIISGGTAESMNASIIQLGQAFSADFQAVGQELASIREQTPRLYQALLEGTGKSSKEFKKLAEEGELSTKIIIDALKSQAGAVNEEFGKINKTVDQSLTQVDNSMLLLIGNVDELIGASEGLSDMFTGFSGVLDNLNIKLKDYSYNIENVHDIHRLNTIEDATRELNQLKDAYRDNINEGVGLFESTTNYNAKIKEQEFQITSLIRKLERLKEETVDLSKIQTEAGGDTSFDIDLQGFSEDIDFVMAQEQALLEERKKVAEETASITSQALATIESPLDSINNKFLEMYETIKDTFDEKQLTKFYKVWQKEVDKTNKKQGGLSKEQKQNYLQVQNTAEAFSDLAGTMSRMYADGSTQAKRAEQAQTALSIVAGITAIANAMASGDGYTAVARGAAVAASLVSYGWKGSGGGGTSSVASYESTIQSAQFGTGQNVAQGVTLADYSGNFDKFIEGLDSATEKLEAFENIGSATSSTLEALEQELQNQQEAFNKIVEEYGYDFKKLLPSGQAIGDTQRQISEILFEELSQNLDYAAYNTEQLTSLTESFNIAQGEAVEQRLADIALLVKQGQDITKFEDELSELFQDEDYKMLQDFGGAIDELTKRTQENATDIIDFTKGITDTINREMLGSLSYLSEAGKIEYANNLYQGAISQDDRISSARSIAELSKSTSRTREDYVPIFSQYINELQKQKEEKTTDDLYNKLEEIRVEVETQTDTQVETAINA